MRTAIICGALALTASTAGAQVVLYREGREGLTNPKIVGSAAWRIEQGIVRADIEIPEQKISARLSLRRNDGGQRSASHVVEITFALPPDFPHGSISNIPGILMVEGAAPRGMPLNAVSVEVAANSFRIDLSSIAPDMQRNVHLLKDSAWFDIPVAYGDGKRVIISIEKGTSGERVFADAFAIWGQ
jgi:hypothetical protein